jgi:hypothetical protein
MDKGNKKTRKQKNVSNFVIKNLDLFKEILDPHSGWMSKVKNSDGKQRYFVKRGDQMVCQLNKFFMDLLEAKIEANPAVEEKNVRRSMDINALITFFEKGRATRPGAGRRNKPKSNAAKDSGQMSLEIDQQVTENRPKPVVTKVKGIDEWIAGHKASQGTSPAPVPPSQPKRAGDELLKRYKHHYGFPESICKTGTDQDLYTTEADQWFIETGVNPPD